jgi:hypothetical protein
MHPATDQTSITLGGEGMIQIIAGFLESVQHHVVYLARRRMRNECPSAQTMHIFRSDRRCSHKVRGMISIAHATWWSRWRIRRLDGSMTTAMGEARPITKENGDQNGAILVFAK